MRDLPTVVQNQQVDFVLPELAQNELATQGVLEILIVFATGICLPGLVKVTPTPAAAWFPAYAERRDPGPMFLRGEANA